MRTHRPHGPGNAPRCSLVCVPVGMGGEPQQVCRSAPGQKAPGDGSALTSPWQAGAYQRACKAKLSSDRCILCGEPGIPMEVTDQTRRSQYPLRRTCAEAPAHESLCKTKPQHGSQYRAHLVEQIIPNLGGISLERVLRPMLLRTTSKEQMQTWRGEAGALQPRERIRAPLRGR